MGQPQTIFQVSAAAAEKELELRRLMRNLPAVLVAYSGGVDSAYLALVATQELGAKALCVTGISPSVSQVQREEAARIAKDFGFNHLIVNTDEINNPEYTANPTNRCYFCKSELYEKIYPIAAAHGIETVTDGSNSDDMSDFRPGKQAAREKGVRSFLVEAEMTKADIRELSRRQNLPTWDKPASPCLSSRIAYGVPVSIERLSKVERGEELLRKMGLKEFRVRLHGDLVRLEIAPSEMERILHKDVTDRLAKDFRSIGFRYITLDLQGYRTGAMNEILDENLKT